MQNREHVASSLTISALLFLNYVNSPIVYFTAITLICDYMAIVVREHSIRKNKSAEYLSITKILTQGIIVFSIVAPTFPHQAHITYCLFATAMAISIINFMQTLILDLYRQDPDWLKETNGHIGPANWVSLTRIALAMIIPHIFISQPFGIFNNLIAFILLVVALSTDAIDGYLARSRNEKTRAGKFLDPLCDKLIFYPTAISMLATDETGLSTILLQKPVTVNLIILLLFVLIIVRDAGFIIWFAVEGRTIKDSEGAHDADRLRFAFMCIWLIIIALILVPQKIPLNMLPAKMAIFGLPIYIGLQYLALSVLVFCGMLSLITIFIALQRRRDILK